MAFEYLGATCFDELFTSAYPTSGVQTIGQPLQDGYDSSVNPALRDLNLSTFSRCGARYSIGAGGKRDNAIGVTRTKNLAVYYGTIAFGNVPSDATRKIRILYSDKNNDVGTVGTGCVALVIQSVNTLNVKFNLSYYDGATWTDGTATGNKSRVVVWYYRLEVDVSGKQAKLWITSSSTLPALGSPDVTLSTGTTVPLANDPSLATYLYAGTLTTFDVDHYEIWWGAGDAESDFPDNGSGTGQHRVWAYYPSTIGNSNDWTAYNVCNLADKWRALRNPEYAAGTLYNDYIESTDGVPTQKQLFGIDFLEATYPSASIKGVYIAIGVAYNADVIPSKIALRQGSTDYNYAAQDVSLQFVAGAHVPFWKYLFLQTAPDNTAWTRPILEALQVGCWNEVNSQTQRARALIVGVIATDAGRPPTLPWCPSFVFERPGIRNNVLLRR